MMMMRTEEWEEYRYVLLLNKSMSGLEPDSGQGMCRSCAHTSPITLNWLAYGFVARALFFLSVCARRRSYSVQVAAILGGAEDAPGALAWFREHGLATH